jgi:23S rRNA (guanosine2251-2'-O)-methyltransferase
MLDICVHLPKSKFLKDKLIIGRKPVLDALNADVELEKVWISSTLKGDIEKDVRRITREKSISLQYVPKERFNTLVPRGSQHQGLAAQLSLVNYIEMDALLPFLYEQGRVPALMVLDGIEDVRNIGAIARSAVWFGLDAIIIGTKRSAMINSFAYKSSAGAIKDIPICRVMSITKALQFLKDSGVKVVVAAGGNDAANETLDYKEPIAVVMGSEGKGASREVMALADEIVSIPGTAKVESLNVSVASALIMYDLYRNRQA